MLRPASWFLSPAVAALTFLCTGPAWSQEGARPRAMRSHTTEIGNSPVQVPLDLATLHPIVTVSVNDSGPFRFVLDTAAGLTLIDSRLAKQLGLGVVGQARVGDATADGMQTADLIRWDSIQLGGVTFRGGMAVAADLSAVYMNEDDRPDGILGFGLFNECMLTLDYPNALVIVEKGELPPADGRDVLAFELTPNIPQIEAQLGGKPVKLVIDSGAATGLVIAESLRDAHATKAPPKAVRFAGRLNSILEVAAARMAGDLTIGRHTVTTPIADFSGVRSLIGYEVLRHFAVCFDQPNKRVRLARAATDAIPSKCCCAAGLRAVRDGDARVIERIIPGSPAAEAGLRVGDRIVSVNGQPSAEIKMAAWRKLMETPGEVKLTVERDREKHELALAVRAVIE